jgi:hypothetical protein
MHALRLDEGHRGRNGSEELVGNRFGGRRRGRRRLLGANLRLRHGNSRRRMPVLEPLEQARKAGVRRDDIAATTFEELPPFGRDRIRVLEVVLEQIARETGVQPVDVSHLVLCTTVTSGTAARGLPEWIAREDGRRHAQDEAHGTRDHGIACETLVAAADRKGDERQEDGQWNQAERPVDDAGQADEDRHGSEEPRNRLCRPRPFDGSCAHARTRARLVRAYVRVGPPCGRGLRGRGVGFHPWGSGPSSAGTSVAGCSGRGSDLIAQYTTQHR